MNENEIKKIIAYGKPSNECKNCLKYKNHDCRGMSTICFGFERKGHKDEN